MSESKEIEKLLAKHLIGVITDQERKQLEAWIESSPSHQAMFNRLCMDETFGKRYKTYSQIDVDHAWRRFNRMYIYRLHLSSLLRYAAIVLLPLLIAGGMWYYSSSTSEKENSVEVADLILPGTPKATLLVPGNKKEILTSTLASQVTVGSSTTALSQSGTLIYPAASNQEEETATENEKETNDKNILETERGGEFWVTFEDGTSVHLNYNTELRYPVKFSASKRTVYLKGEAYFKIAKDSRPFYVVTEEGTVKQYGTEFNVNTFTPGRTEVVLVRGSISITPNENANEQLIKPGQLARIEKETGNILVRNVDTEPYVAWNNGRLVFEDRTLESIMDVLKHWYGVNVNFGSPDLKQLHFTGNMNRYGSINPILKAIARTTNLNIYIRGRNVIITSN
nr:FecR domain-containing protein [uncultured Bacteroides sp.]